MKSTNSTGSTLVLLPRELGQVPPPVGVVGMKGRGLCQLLTLKARVPRFGIVCAEAFDQHKQHRDVQDALRDAEAAAVVDDATLIGLGEQLLRAALRAPLSTALRLGLEELAGSFGDADVFAVRASVVGDAAEAHALAGALDAALGVKNLDETVHRMFALAFHPRTLQARVAAGLPPFATRIAVVVQRLVTSEQSGVCWSLDTGSDSDERRRRPLVRLRSTLGLAGGIGGVRGNPRIACDSFTIERPAVADEGLADDARVQVSPQKKPDALRINDEAERARGGTRMVAVDEPRQSEPSLSTVQARMVAKEAIRLEAAFGKPQAVSFSFAGRLLHILDVEPLMVPQARVESTRQRTWDERLVPASLSQQPSSTLTFSVWQRGSARGLERAGRLLGVRGELLEETRPNFRRALGVVTGRITGNVEVLVALLDLLPFAEKAREALAASTAQPEIGARKEAPPPGFWQRARQKIDDGRWPGQLDRLSQVAAGEGDAFGADVTALLAATAGATGPTVGAGVAVENEDPDALLDRFDALEEALGKCVAALIMHGIVASLFLVELRDGLAEIGQAGLENDLLAGDEEAAALLDGPRRLATLVRVVDEDPDLKALFAAASDQGGDADVVAALADEPSFRPFRTTLQAFCDVGLPEGSLILDEPRLLERPERLVHLLLRLVHSPRMTLDARVRDAVGRRKKAEYALDQATEKLGGLKSSSSKKRCAAALSGARKHGRAFGLLWLPLEGVVAQLRRVALALGERLFEHGLLDQPKDVFHLQDMEVAGVIRGTGPDVDVRPLVQARRRSVTARPPAMSRRIETRGVVATSLLVDDETILTSPGEVPELQGTAVVAGVVNGAVCLADRYPDAVDGVRGVVVVSSASLFDLPLFVGATAVVAERGAALSPVCQALRLLGIPTVVEAPAASMIFTDGEDAHVDGDHGIVTRAGHVSAAARPAAPLVATAEQFLREAIATDPGGPRAGPGGRPPRRAGRPADFSSEMPAPPGGGLHRMVSEDGAPIGDDDVLEENEA